MSNLYHQSYKQTQAITGRIEGVPIVNLASPDRNATEAHVLAGSHRVACQNLILLCRTDKLLLRGVVPDAHTVHNVGPPVLNEHKNGHTTMSCNV